jgi:hypothetical protein
LSRVLTDENDQTYGFRNSFRRRAAHSLPCRAAHLHLDETVAIQIALTNFIEIETRSVVNRYDDAAVRQKKLSQQESQWRAVCCTRLTALT